MSTSIKGSLSGMHGFEPFINSTVAFQASTADFISQMTTCVHALCDAVFGQDSAFFSKAQIVQQQLHLQACMLEVQQLRSKLGLSVNENLMLQHQLSSKVKVEEQLAASQQLVEDLTDEVTKLQCACYEEEETLNNLASADEELCRLNVRLTAITSEKEALEGKMEEVQNSLMDTMEESKAHCENLALDLEVSMDGKAQLEFEIAKLKQMLHLQCTHVDTLCSGSDDQASGANSASCFSMEEDLLHQSQVTLPGETPTVCDARVRKKSDTYGAVLVV